MIISHHLSTEVICISSANLLNKVPTEGTLLINIYKSA